jgi:hypothetical protein
MRRIGILVLICLTVCSACSQQTEQQAADSAKQESTSTKAEVSVDFDDPKVAPLDVPTGDIVFVPVASIQQQPAEVQGALRRAVIAVPSDWPASFLIIFKTLKGQASCTAALVGPEVMLTAAHCVPTSGAVAYRAGGQTRGMNCQRHPDWLQGIDPSADYALCRLDQPFQAPPGFKYETVDATSFGGLISKPVLLSGYGCISDKVAEHGHDGAYRIGANVVDETSQSAARKRGQKYYMPSGQKNNLITREDGTNLCPGDSGGPAFQRTNAAGAGQFNNRKIIGVNSRVFFRNPEATHYGASLISATGTPGFLNWGREWLNQRNLPACGITGTLPNCRS